MSLTRPTRSGSAWTWPDRRAAALRLLQGAPCFTVSDLACIRGESRKVVIASLGRQVRPRRRGRTRVYDSVDLQRLADLWWESTVRTARIIVDGPPGLAQEEPRRMAS